MTGPRPKYLIRATPHGPDRGEDWRDRASCLEEDPGLFTPKGYGPTFAAQIEAAKAVCARCPVQAECLAAAEELSDGHDIWGGLTPDERSALRRKAKSA